MYKKTLNKLRVVHIGRCPSKPFIVEVRDEYEAQKVISVLSDHHLYLNRQQLITDFTNVYTVEMSVNGKWFDYWNGMNWDEFVEQFIENKEEQ